MIEWRPDGQALPGGHLSGHWSSLSSMWKAEDVWGTCVPVPFTALHQSLAEIRKVGSWTLTTHPKPQGTEVTVLKEAGNLGSLCGRQLAVFFVFSQLCSRDKLEREP